MYNAEQVKTLALNLGYKVDFDEETKTLQILVIPRRQPDHTYKFTPEIVGGELKYKRFWVPWKIFQTAYGAFSPGDVDLVITGLQRAQRMIQILNNSEFNLSKYKDR